MTERVLDVLGQRPVFLWKTHLLILYSFIFCSSKSFEISLLSALTQQILYIAIVSFKRVNTVFLFFLLDWLTTSQNCPKSSRQLRDTLRKWDSEGGQNYSSAPRTTSSNPIGSMLLRRLWHITQAMLRSVLLLTSAPVAPRCTVTMRHVLNLPLSWEQCCMNW